MYREPKRRCLFTLGQAANALAAISDILDTKGRSFIVIQVLYNKSITV